MQRSVKEPPPLFPYQPRKKSLDAGSDSLKAHAGSVSVSSVSSDDGKEELLYRVDPNEVDVLKALEQEANGAGDECSHGFWTRILGVNPEGRQLRMHKKIPSNHSRLRHFQKVRQFTFMIVSTLKFNFFRMGLAWSHRLGTLSSQGSEENRLMPRLLSCITRSTLLRRLHLSCLLYTSPSPRDS